MIVLFWDIDGTLLTTGKAGVPAWEEAVKEVDRSRLSSCRKFRIAGLTDYQIAVRTFEMLGVDVNEDQIRRMVKRYEELLPGSVAAASRDACCRTCARFSSGSRTGATSARIC